MLAAMRALALLALTALGCGSTIIIPAAPDSGAADAGSAADAAPAPTDAPSKADGPAPTDAALAPLNGRWRLTRLEFTADDGTRRELTDVDTPLSTAGGAVVPARANGVMIVADDRIALTSSTLVNGHFYTSDTGYSANGFGVAGLLEQSTGVFTPVGAAPGAGVTLLRNEDGTVSFTGAGLGGNRITYARAATSARVDRISTVGLAMIRETMPPSTAALSLRVALFWDRVGAVPATETNGVAVRFTGRYASFPVVLAGPPPAELRAQVGVASVALARIALYVDQDGNQTFDRNVDRAVAISPVGIAWRDDTAAAETGNNPVRDLAPGYQLVHVHEDSGLGRAAVTPFDNNNLVAPDLPVILSMSSTPVITDVL
jgi:hypothetical protein